MRRPSGVHTGQPSTPAPNVRRVNVARPKSHTQMSFSSSRASTARRLPSGEIRGLKYTRAGAGIDSSPPARSTISGGGRRSGLPGRIGNGAGHGDCDPGCADWAGIGPDARDVVHHARPVHLALPAHARSNASANSTLSCAKTRWPVGRTVALDPPCTMTLRAV